ncbi:hypothetical protein [Nocardioides sp. Kera G14]|uniref:hypothetical protein n=1 Tax=Nocardioides sp. Kera G14 TaxID=2884264 RepID=UPI001D111D0E|nr:hypothetical protein [Nocardioides sp. Kera G14]UDY22977.1 hypothetical protein LH076_13005 [Nocardioides sp. Kera G14]
MMPAVNDPVHLADEEGEELPGFVLQVEGDHVFTVRLDEGQVGQIGSNYDLVWAADGSAVQQVRVVVVERLLIDGIPVARVHPNGEVRRVQRRQYVRVPAQREVRLMLDPIPLDPELLGVPKNIVGLTLDIAEAAVRCSVKPQDAAAYGVGTGVEAHFSLGAETFVIRGEIGRVREMTDLEPPRVELVLMIEEEESVRTAIRRALFAEQVRLRAGAR